jgi:CHAD domain-containing protein
MVAEQKNTRLLFGRLNRQLAKLSGKPAAESVHRFRTSGRRLEVLLSELAPNPGRSGKKLLKLLARLRKKAGRVRDLDVQIALLRGLKMPEGARHKAQLLQLLMEERIQREKKVAEAFDKPTVRELRKRLKRTAGEIKVAEGEAWEHAQSMLSKLEHQAGPLTEKVLHQYRIVGKRARYLAELAGKNPEAAQLVEQLKSMQDVLGDWHDWLKLTQRAENLFSVSPGSPLVAALRNLTRAKFHNALAALSEARATMARKKPASGADTSNRKAASSVPAAATAA